MIPPVFKILLSNKLFRVVLIEFSKGWKHPRKFVRPAFLHYLKKIHKEVELGNTYPTH